MRVIITGFLTEIEKGMVIKMEKKVPQIWAHRGASGYVPENTIEAFDKAVEMKADGVELDVQLTKDGQMVVIHDETVDRVSDKTGFVRDYTLSQIKELDVSLPIEDYHTVRIPTLAEVLELLKPTGLEINIELKTGIYFYQDLEEKVIRLVEDMKMTDRIWCSSFNHESVCRLKKLCKGMRCGFLLSDVIMDVAAYAKHYDMQALHPALYHMQDENFITNAKKQGLSVHVWTVNKKEEMRVLAEAGADALITNYPDLAVKTLLYHEKDTV